MHEVDIVRERDGGYVASIEGGEQRFEVHSSATIQFGSAAMA